MEDLFVVLYFGDFDRSFFYAQNQAKMSPKKAFEHGGEDHAHKNYTGLYRMQAEKLQYNERKEEHA